MLNLGAVWGIDIGDAALKAVKLKRVGNQTVLQDFQVIHYSDIGGELGCRRDDHLADAMVALAQAGLGRDRCVVSIAPQTVFSRFISLPPVDKRRVPEIVRYEARQQIPFNLNEVVWAYETVRKEFIPGEEIEIGLFAAKREVIEAYLAELQQIWRQIHGIQIAPLALYNFIQHDVTLERPTVVMDIGSQSTDLIIMDGERFWLRNLPIAGNSFTSALEKRLNISRGEAEKLKRGLAESRHRRKLLEVLRPVMRDLVAEVQRSIGYYKSLAQDVKLEDVLVVGAGYRLFGLDRFLADQLQYTVTSVEQFQNIPYQGSPERADELGQAIPSLGVAIGLALQGLGEARATVDLLPDDFVIQREMHGSRFNGLVAAGLVWAIVGCLFFSETSGLKRAKEMEEKGQSTLGEVEKHTKALKGVKRSAVRDKVLEFNKRGAHRMYYPRIIDAISKVIPRGITVSEFAFSEPGKGFGDFRRGPGGGPMDDGPPRGGGKKAGGKKKGAKGKESDDGDKDRRAVRAADLMVAFDATCDASKEHGELTEKLPNALKTATILLEGVEIVVGVSVGEVNRDSGTGRAAGGGGSAREGNNRALDPERRKEGGSSVQKQETKLRARVEVGLVVPKQIDEALEKK